MSRKKLFAGTIIILAVLVVIGSVYSDTSRKQGSSPEADVGVIYIDGMIVGGWGNDFFGGVSGSEELMRQIREAAGDPEIRAVVLRINSPGGSVAATQEVARELEKLKESGKIIVSSMGDVAASGGYWLAAKTDKIYANDGTITGSIGVRIDHQNLEELYDKLGIKFEIIKSGPQKDLGSTNRDLTIEERQILQGMVDDMYEEFIRVVAEGRNMPQSRVRELATGRIWTGGQAREIGLVDEMGNFYDAVNGAAKMVGVSGEPELKYYGEQGWLYNLLGGSLSRFNSDVLLQDYVASKLFGPKMLAVPDIQP